MGLNGVSFLAMSQYPVAAGRARGGVPRCLKAICPWEGLHDPYQDMFFEGGVQEQGFPLFWWHTEVKNTINTSMEDFVRIEGQLPHEMAETHPFYDDYWQDQALDRQLAKVPRKVPVLTVHSLFDQEDIYGPLASHAAMIRRDRSARRTHLAIGPWCHGQSTGDGSSLGSLQWDADTSKQFRDGMLKPFWDHHLKGKRPAEPLPWLPLP